MASLSTDRRTGSRRIQFVDLEGNRKAIRLGKIPKKAAESFKCQLELLLAARTTGTSPAPDTSRWVAGLPDEMAEKLAKAGIFASRQKPQTSSLEVFLQDYSSKRIDVKPATKVIWRHVGRNLVSYFGRGRELGTISEGDAEDFKLFLIGQELAPTTVHKRLQVARMFFRYALKRGLVRENPFAEVTAKAIVSDDRWFFVTVEATSQLLTACDPTWRLIVGLCRYGGLRCPSEVLSLRWSGVDWANSRILVESPKTECHAKASRVMPIFRELRPFLEEAFELAPEGAEYVVAGNHRLASLGPEGWRNCNLRTPFNRIITRAGLVPWPRLFQAMRSSRETDLARSYPIHVVTAWLGNTPKIALKHYLQVTDADFAEAAERGAESGALVAQNAAQHTLPQRIAR